jgi:hypothetical protein
MATRRKIMPKGTGVDMSLRAISAQRFLASDAALFGAVFTALPSLSGASHNSNDKVPLGRLTVLSPAMFLPAVIAQAEAIAKFAFGSTEVLGVRRKQNELGLFGVEADVLAIDGSPAGILRSTLLLRASQQVFKLNTAERLLQIVDLSGIREYYVTEGADAIRGSADDVLTDDARNYDWKQI